MECLQLVCSWMYNCGRLTSYPFKRQPHKMVKHAQTICQQQTTNCLSVFDYFVGLALKGLSAFLKISVLWQLFSFFMEKSGDNVIQSFWPYFYKVPHLKVSFKSLHAFYCL